MAVFRWRYLADEIISRAVRWYYRCRISDRELKKMMGEEGIAVDHTMLYRWMQRPAPELEHRQEHTFAWLGFHRRLAKDDEYRAPTVGDPDRHRRYPPHAKGLNQIAPA